MPHVIRLREPWQHSEIPGGTRHARSFNWLAGLQPGQCVWLVIDAVGLSSVTLNGCSVGQASRLPDTSGNSAKQDASPTVPTACDITSLLASRNEIVLELTGDQTKLGEVRLEID